MANEKSKPKTSEKKATPKSRQKSNTSNAQKTKKKMTDEEIKKFKMMYELKMLSLIAITLFMMLALYTEAVGILGQWITLLFRGMFSYIAYVIPIVFFIFIYVRLNPHFKPAKKRATAGVLLMTLSFLIMNTLMIHPSSQREAWLNQTEYEGRAYLKYVFEQSSSLEAGGIIGELMTKTLWQLVGIWGTIIIIFALFLSGFIVFTHISIQELWQKSKVKREKKQLQKEEQEELEKLLVQQKEAERLEAQAIESEQKLSKQIAQFRKIKEKPYEKSDDFLSQLDMIKREKRKNKRQSVFTEDPYSEPSTQLKETSKPLAQDPIEEMKVEEEAIKSDDFIADEPIISEIIPANFYREPQVEEETLLNSIDSFQSFQEDLEEKNDDEQLEVLEHDDLRKEEPKEEIEEKVNKPQPEKEISEKEVTHEIKKSIENQVKNYKKPPLKILNHMESKPHDNPNEHMETARALEETLNHFNVKAKVVGVKKGPSITMFEVQLSPGVKVSKVIGLSEDIALNLASSQVRIAPIPGKTAIGIEVPNSSKSMVTMKEVLDSDAFKKSESKLSVGLGKDISGNPIIGDLASMPHLLIAGATGSGKSVCVNTIISSILFQATPEEVKFLMIDPKVVELNNYNGIPHLILPVVTDPKKAAIALNWAVNEMTRRYQVFSDTAVRDMKSYNRKAKEDGLEILPQIVVIIDELADLMMVAPNQVEDAICRLAQMARAAGIHLIVATQRPSVDVITGLIKANIPSRIAFSVSSAVDSRTIIDMGGAEKLLGKGDMLYYPVGAAKPRRAQGAFMSDEEVEKLVSFIKDQSLETHYREEIIEQSIVESNDSNEEVDELLEEAIACVIELGQASASMLQRKFRVGYNRAARLIEAMEAREIVGPARGSKPREVLAKKEDFGLEAEEKQEVVNQENHEVNE